MQCLQSQPQLLSSSAHHRRQCVRPHARGAHRLGNLRARVAAPLTSSDAAPQQQQQTPTHADSNSESTLSPQGGAAPETNAIWKRVWLPATPTDMLDPSKPNKIMLLGKDLVAWYSKQDGWQVFEDRCPHRFAPLSLGRIVDDESTNSNSLVCSYHGWSFGASGACLSIPQLPAGQQQQAACSLPKACARAHPCVENDGLLFIWMDNSADGLLASTQTKPYTSSAPSTFSWIMVRNPNDYTFWLEQGVDPSHAPFLHHGIGGFKMENATDMQSSTVQEVTVEGGFEWAHRGYETRNKEMTATRQFIPPFAIETRYNKSATGSPSTQAFTSYVVPVQPGVSLTIFRFATLPPNPPPSDSADASAPPSTSPPPQKSIGGMLFSLAGKLPHWLFMAMELSDQDTIIMHQQEIRIKKAGLRPIDYALLAPGADAGVAAINRWMRQAGPPGPQWHLPHASSLQDIEEAPLDQLLSRRTRHVDFCKTCQQGLQQVTFACQVVTGAACVTGVTAINLIMSFLSTLSSSSGTAAANVSAAVPALTATLLAVALVKAASWLWDFREERFISGIKSWTRKGGLSLVKS